MLLSRADKLPESSEPPDDVGERPYAAAPLNGPGSIKRSRCGEYFVRRMQTYTDVGQTRHLCAFRVGWVVWGRIA